MLRSAEMYIVGRNENRSDVRDGRTERTKGGHSGAGPSLLGLGELGENGERSNRSQERRLGTKAQRKGPYGVGVGQVTPRVRDQSPGELKTAGQTLNRGEEYKPKAKATGTKVGRGTEEKRNRHSPTKRVFGGKTSGSLDP